ncbi:histidine triad (HIT) family protein [Chryseolinea serpens]|uniref:Histidine triad (HIT) family protein n=1 Tax=Chryseolinea serpens TaxID=947013 RepID=A0A1M5UAR5_9BACT|nr:HIT family protein [Chryseolinea serpens]SHH60112.1 histidine triad (HIT) family protein [Chryseolinea serpens]
MASIFTKIINREIPAHIVAEDERYIAFLDINPLVLGHALVVPKQEIDFLFDLDDDTLAGINVFAKKVAHAIKKAVPCRRVGVAVIGLEVPHAHVHLIPMNTMNDINFTRPKLNPSSAELTQVAEAIRKAVK